MDTMECKIAYILNVEELCTTINDMCKIQLKYLMISNMHYNIIRETIVLQQLAIYYIHQSREKMDKTCITYILYKT